MTHFHSDMDLDVLMNRFRVASRELFNHFFHSSTHDEEPWFAQERHQEVETALFWALVTAPAELTEVPYGELQPEILIEPNFSGELDWMLNRERDSGYWDDDLKHAPTDSKINFLSFFQWDWLGIRDYDLVKVVVTASPSNERLIGKQALVQVSYSKFVRALSVG
jgi:hypothetical protein